MCFIKNYDQTNTFSFTFTLTTPFLRGTDSRRLRTLTQRELPRRTRLQFPAGKSHQNLAGPEISRRYSRQDRLRLGGHHGTEIRNHVSADVQDRRRAVRTAQGTLGGVLRRWLRKFDEISQVLSQL